jgi:subtilisin-like proprotein convertase family protein
VSLDIEMAASMAPGLSKIIVYMAPNSTGYWDDLLNQMADDNLARQLSCSWSGGSHNATHDQIFQQMAAQGQSFFCASGDSDAFTGSIPFPADSTNIVQVGGTLLTTGAGATYASETVWNPGGGVGSSGGISTHYSIPAYQQGISMATNQGSTAWRNVPDVAMVATQVYARVNSGDYSMSGTSCAAPLWAGFCALVNQQAAAGNLQPVGFLNPALYAIGKGSGYAAAFHDITTGNNTNSASPSKFYATTGYDLCTGWGTPNGTNLINALAPFDSSVPHLALTGAQMNDSSSGNTNGFPDPGETIQETVVWTNNGGVKATNITASLVTAAAGVTLLQATSAYSDIPVLASASNATPFSYRLSKSIPAGTVLAFTNLVNSGGLVFTGTFSRTVGEPPATIAAAATNTSGVTIPASSTIYLTNVVMAATNNVIGLVTASVRLNFNYDGYLVVALQHPDGTEVVLANKQGGSGQNYGTGYPSAGATVSTIFDDRAATAISAGSAPFAGTYRPDGALANFIGKSVAGAWRLRLTASSSFFYYGTFYKWGLVIVLAPTQYTATVFDHPPVASNQNVRVPYAGTTNLVLRGSDPDGDALTFGIAAFPGHGALTNFNANSGAIT